MKHIFFTLLACLGIAGASIAAPSPIQQGNLVVTPGGGTIHFGFVATGCRQPYQADASVKQFMSRTYHISTDDISVMQVAWGNWHHSELNLGGTATITASIEYPAGTYTRITFAGGNTSGTVAAGSNIFSDFINLPAKIPAGSAFWIKTYWVSANGSQWTTGNSTIDGGNSGTSGIADTTMSSGPVGNGVAVIRPLAILGYTSKPSIVLYGDSRSFGWPGDYGDATGTQGYERFVSKYGGYSNLTQPGEAASDFISAHSLRSMFAKYATHILENHGINDIAAGTSLSTMQSRIATIVGYFPGQPVFWCTEEPETTSTDNWKTVINQTVGAHESVRVAFNDALRGLGGGVGFYGLSGYVEVADCSESGRNSGFWKPGFTTDGAHSGTAAVNIVRSLNIPIYGSGSTGTPPEAADQFLVKLASDFSFPQSADTKVPFDTALININGKFDTVTSHGWQPSAGGIIIGVVIQLAEFSGNEVHAVFYKNGSELAHVSFATLSTFYVPIAFPFFDIANGTDVYDFRIYDNGTARTVGSAASFFWGTKSK